LGGTLRRNQIKFRKKKSKNCPQEYTYFVKEEEGIRKVDRTLSGNECQHAISLRNLTRLRESNDLEE